MLEEKSGLGPEGAVFSRIIEAVRDSREESARERLPWSKLSPSKGRGDGRAISSQGGPSRVDTIRETKESGVTTGRWREGRQEEDGGICCWASHSAEGVVGKMVPRGGHCRQCCCTVDKDSLEYGFTHARLG